MNGKKVLLSLSVLISAQGAWAVGETMFPAPYDPGAVINGEQRNYEAQERERWLIERRNREGRTRDDRRDRWYRQPPCTLRVFGRCVLR